MAAIESIVELLKANPELSQSLNQLTDLDQAATEITRIAAENGIETTPGDVRAHLKSPQDGELSDEALQDVSGGGAVITGVLGAFIVSAAVCIVPGIIGGVISIPAVSDRLNKRAAQRGR